MRVTPIFALAVFVAVGAVRCTGCDSGYSDGSRAGQVVKFSQKGLLVKSFEGELNLGGFKTKSTDNGNQVVANVFEFTVRNPALVPKVQAAMESGNRVTLVYRQWLMSPWTMDSRYEVVEVREAPTGQ